MSTRLQNWFRRWVPSRTVASFPGKSGRWPAKSNRARLSLDQLEDRVVPAVHVFNVNSTADILNPPAGVVTLRSAIAAANADPGTDTINLKAAGTYNITIPGANTGTDNSGAFAILPPSASGDSLTIINASGGGVTVNGNHLDRVFDINPNLGATPNFSVIMQGFTITGGMATPGIGNEPGHDREWAECIVFAFLHRAVGTNLKELPVDDHHFAIQVLEGAEAEIAVLAQGPDPHGALVNALDEGGRCGDLIERMVRHLKVVRQRVVDDVRYGLSS